MCALATVVLIAGVPPWDQIQRSTAPQIEDLYGEFSIGVVLPLTGALAAPYGLPMQRGREALTENSVEILTTSIAIRDALANTKTFDTVFGV